MESSSDPALKAIFSLAVMEGSAKSSKGRIGCPKGGTEPGTRPVNSLQFVGGGEADLLDTEFFSDRGRVGFQAGAEDEKPEDIAGLHQERFAADAQIFAASFSGFFRGERGRVVDFAETRSIGIADVDGSGRESTCVRSVTPHCSWATAPIKLLLPKPSSTRPSQ